jgi:hypothetical protein
MIPLLRSMLNTIILKVANKPSFHLEKTGMKIDQLPDTNNHKCQVMKTCISNVHMAVVRFCYLLKSHIILICMLQKRWQLTMRHQSIPNAL